MFNRAFTEALGLDDENAWTRRLIAEYGENLKKGSEGDIPAPGITYDSVLNYRMVIGNNIVLRFVNLAGFAGEAEFWSALFYSGLFGVIMGFAGLLFLNIADHVPKEWVNNGNFNTPEDADLYNGKKSWIVVTGSAGLIVGLVR